MNRRSTTLLGGIAALAMLAAGCGGDPTPATASSSSATSSATSATHPAGHATPGAQQPGGGAPAPTHNVTPKTTTQPAPGNPAQPDCSGPNPGTICTNPNYGAGTDPNENGGDSSIPTTTQQRDDDPGGKPCTTGMGVAGVYIYDGETWVCQIS